MIRGELDPRPGIRERSYRGENPGPARMIRGELDPRPGIREQPGSMAAVRPLEGLVRFALDSVAKLGKRRLTRNNRIGAKDLLNRCCALVAVLESMLPARAPQIVLQQNRGASGH